MGKRILRISDTLLLSILQEGQELHYRIAKDGLPADARIVRFAMEGAWRNGRGNAVLLLESGAWGPTPQDQPYAVIEPILQSLYPAGGAFVPFAESL